MTQEQRAATDPVCGMTVDIEDAVRTGLTAEHDGLTYYFCSKGCKLDFVEDPRKVLAPDHRPSM